MEMIVIQPNYQSEVLKLFAKNQQKMIKRSIDSHAMVRFFRTSKVGCVFPSVGNVNFIEKAQIIDFSAFFWWF